MTTTESPSQWLDAAAVLGVDLDAMSDDMSARCAAVSPRHWFTDDDLRALIAADQLIGMADLIAKLNGGIGASFHQECIDASDTIRAIVIGVCLHRGLINE